jgi:hypothetical protein
MKKLKLVVGSIVFLILIGTSLSSCKKDKEPPVITILGNNPVNNACRGIPYIDAGATATDNEDGDVTSKIETSSTVDTGQVGTYKVTYTVKDEAGNQAVEQREVNVIYCK